MTAGLEMETAGVTGKLKETAGSEAEMVAGTESGAGTEVGTDLKLTADQSRSEWSGGGSQSERKVHDHNHWR